MPISTAQADRITAYYSARKDYNKLLFEALDDAPPNQYRVHPLQRKKGEKEPAEPKQPDKKGTKEPKPGEFLQELVDMLEEHRISGPGGPKFPAGAGVGKAKAEGKGKR